MLRASASGVQRVIPQKAAGAGPSRLVTPTSVGASRSGGVLSFKSIAQPPPDESVAEVLLPTAKAIPRAKAAANAKRILPGLDDCKEEPMEPDEEDREPEEERGERRPIMNPLAPTAKAPPPPSSQTRKKAETTNWSQRGVVAQSRQPTDPKEEPAEEPPLENEEWAKQFEKKWAEAMAEPGSADTAAGEHGACDPPPPKRQRLVPTQSTAAPLPQQRFTPITPGDAPGSVVASQKPRPDAAQIRDEHPEWATRCTVEPARPGQPQRLTISMAEMSLGDAGLAEWCAWMDRRLASERPEGPGKTGGARNRFKANTIDFSDNQLGVVGVKALCLMLENQGVRCDVLRLTGNNIGNEGVRCIAKYLTCSSHALASELLMTRNRVTGEGLKWLLGSLSLHPAYPIWSTDTNRYVPLWIRAENPKLKGQAGYQVLASACSALSCSVCLGEESGEIKCGPRQCVNVGCCDELKHNCVAHICSWEMPEAAAPLPAPAAHARLIFAQPGRGAPKGLPSGVEAPVREEPRVIYEDDDLAVILKPGGWSCMPQPKGVNPAWSKLKPLARRQQVGELLVQLAPPPLQGWLLLHFGADPNCDASRDQASDRGIAHRLDVDASGPLLVGKTLRGYEHARKQIAAGLLKDYLVLVHGSFDLDRGECHAPIDTSMYAETKRVRIDSSGQPATTVWEAIAEYESPDSRERYTLVNCRMVTLRTHQLRVHLQHLGHSLVGDKLYGDGDIPAFCPRLFLHKMRIGFFNLQGQACIELCSLQTAPDLWKALGRLRKVGGMAMMGCGAPGL